MACFYCGDLTNRYHYFLNIVRIQYVKNRKFQCAKVVKIVNVECFFTDSKQKRSNVYVLRNVYT